jgi:plasmid stabilization system protein ParE
MIIRYTSESALDLGRLRKFIAEKNLTAANRVVNELIQEINKLCKCPLIGVKVTSAIHSSEIRDLFIGHYTIRYLIASNDIYILRLWYDKENERN